MRSPANWQGIAAVIVAVGFATAIIILSAQELLHSGHVSADEATLLATVLGAAIGAIATYLGTRRSNDNNQHE